MTTSQRYLIFLAEVQPTLIDHLRKNGCYDIIFRRCTDGTEIDFHSSNPGIIDSIISRFRLIRWVRIDEETSAYDQSKRDTIISLEKELSVKANDLINQQRYWEAHTVLENLWKAYDGETKAFYQGVILILASLVQYQMGKVEPASSLYGRAIKILSNTSSGNNIISQIPQSFAYPLFFRI